MDIMDRLKFRAYIKSLKMMVLVINIDFMEPISVGVYLIRPDSTPQDIADYEGGLYEYSLDEVELMQCTGLRDNAGNLVFEGDILAPTIGYDDFASEVKIVTREDEGWFLNEIQGNCQHQMEYADDLDIIGNIYENAELLEDIN